MVAFFRHIVWVLLAATALAGCYGKPVRHLASDAALIKVGESTRNDVLTYLGEPDEQVVLGGGAEQWVYREYEENIVKKAPLVGKYFGKPDYGTVTLKIQDNVVTECVYGSWESDNRDWADDFGWQEEKEGD
jgi:hypothetical protein